MGFFFLLNFSEFYVEPTVGRMFVGVFAKLCILYIMRIKIPVEVIRS